MQIVFLYTELAAYSVACFQQTVALYPNVAITVIRWPINNEAPFDFSFEGLTVKQKNEFKENELIDYLKSINPNIIVCSGWIDKLYLKACKVFKGKIPTILALDNHWTGSIKQRLAKFLSPFALKPKFSHVWVPGNAQFDYAIKLGFKAASIHKGFYSANVDLFNSYFDKYKKTVSNDFPKRLLYVGRYVHHKGIFDLWEAFVQIQNQQPNNWELWCVGTGDQWNNRVQHPKIKHLGFLQPNALDDVIKNTSIYVLPSHFEPWGVSLHEYVAAGFPVVCSDKVGSAEQFLNNHNNGFSFPAGNVQKLKEALLKCMQLTPSEYHNMVTLSVDLAQNITPQIWTKTLVEFTLKTPSKID